MNAREFPIKKTDIQYDPQRDEVTLKCEKFDELVSLSVKLIEELENAEAQGVSARYHARRIVGLRGVLREAQSAVESWLSLPGHSVRLLSQRAGIPYATCHRIVRTQIPTKKVEVGALVRILEVVEEKPLVSREQRKADSWVYVWGARSRRGVPRFVSVLRNAGVEVATVKTAREFRQHASRLNPKRIVVDAHAPNEIVDQAQDLVKKNPAATVIVGNTAGNWEEMLQQMTHELEIKT